VSNCSYFYSNYTAVLGATGDLRFGSKIDTLDNPLRIDLGDKPYKVSARCFLCLL